MAVPSEGGGLESTAEFMTELMAALPATLAIFTTILVGFFIITRGIGPFIDDVCSAVSAVVDARRRDRDKRSKREPKSLLVAEIALRDEFDEWLAAWELRLKIECAAHPDDQDRAGALAAVELAKRENAARIVALHQDGDTALAKPDGPEAVKREWKDLEAKCAALRS